MSVHEVTTETMDVPEVEVIHPTFECAVTIGRHKPLSVVKLQKALKAKRDGERAYPEVEASDVLAVEDGFLVEFELCRMNGLMAADIGGAVVRALTIVRRLCSEVGEVNPIVLSVSAEVVDGQAGTTALDFETLVEAKHPLRAAILRTMVEGEWSPKMMAEYLGEPLGNVSYHVRELVKKGKIVETRTEPRRGAVEHYYVLALGLSVR